jgi:hypothetical protein
MQSGPVPESDLVDVIKLLLEYPDLTRWKNWSFHQRLMSMFDEKEFQAGSIRRAIVRYMLCGHAGGRSNIRFSIGHDSQTESGHLGNEGSEDLPGRRTIHEFSAGTATVIRQVDR